MVEQLRDFRWNTWVEAEFCGVNEGAEDSGDEVPWIAGGICGFASLFVGFANDVAFSNSSAV